MDNSNTWKKTFGEVDQSQNDYLLQEVCATRAFSHLHQF